MARLPRVTIVLGTRPEAIKLAPVIQEFRACKSLETRVVLTGQHREMVSQVMDLFGLSADLDLNLMTPRQTLTHVTCAALQGLRDDFQAFPPNLVLVQGDTTTAFAAALSAFYEQIPVGHVEAGLRTDNLLDPFPEEANRRLISQIAHLHFAPTRQSEANLQASGVVGRVMLTGNTVIDALLRMSERAPVLRDLTIDWDLNALVDSDQDGDPRNDFLWGNMTWYQTGEIRIVLQVCDGVGVCTSEDYIVTVLSAEEDRQQKSWDELTWKDFIPNKESAGLLALVALVLVLGWLVMRQKDEDEIDAEEMLETYDVQEVEAEGGLPGMDQHTPPPQPKYLTVDERRNKESGYVRPIRTRRR